MQNFSVNLCKEYSCLKLSIRRISLFRSNCLATILIVVVCIALLIDNSYTIKIIIQFSILSQDYQIKFYTFVTFRQKRHICMNRIKAVLDAKGIS